ncbi:recombination mediator RecR [Fimbriimonas ginsengisoli]|uniref:Recombination protein RecR n=1 Tax=Fimbriimonas ginsengisoli Gsoil 348 TaxID=661478 RepID=A0A068NUI2_FIMGI|nr:recombination mediator RecR [Fimbriimonas ginsengisoli]AIE87076.1 recombination protein recr [Fimbriimonas ginsengisoli Gsoil 348]
MLFARPLAELISELEKLPGVGPKSAQRLAYHLLRVPEHEAVSLANAIRNAKQRLRFCVRCQNISEAETCEICLDGRRDRSMVCIVAEPRDIAAIERIHEYKGGYHVLHGLLSPMDGLGPEQLRVKELLGRLADGDIEEIILATNPTIEGDATALYLAKLLKPIGLKVTRLAHGMPVGGELDYADSATLLSALEYRREM